MHDWQSCGWHEECWWTENFLYISKNGIIFVTLGVQVHGREHVQVWNALFVSAAAKLESCFAAWNNKLTSSSASWTVWSMTMTCHSRSSRNCWLIYDIIVLCHISSSLFIFLSVSLPNLQFLCRSNDAVAEMAGTYPACKHHAVNVE